MVEGPDIEIMLELMDGKGIDEATAITLAGRFVLGETKLARAVLRSAADGDDASKKFVEIQPRQFYNVLRDLGYSDERLREIDFLKDVSSKGYRVHPGAYELGFR